MMGVEIREVDLDRELGVLSDTFNANFTIKGSFERFRWLYFDNPDGRATAWFAIDDRNGAIAGCTAVLPRRVRLKDSGRVVVAWNCGDFCINPAYRTLGVAVKLRRVARDAVDAGQAAFLYAHPNDRMLQVHLRVGHTPLGAMVRYAKLLRPRNGSRLARTAAGTLLRFVGKEILVDRRHDVEIIQDREPPEDITAIYDRATSRIGTAVVRDRPYLNWRFRQSPVEAHTMLVTRASGRPAGYVVFSARDDVAMVKDWLAVDEPSRDELFAAMIAWCRDHDLATISVSALESHPDLPVLRAFGFVRRPEQTTAIAYAGGHTADTAAVRSPASWYMTVGDRDL
jgi:hypothetical protein